MNRRVSTSRGLPERDVFAVEALSRILKPELVDGILAETGRVEKRLRRLSMRLVLALVVAMALFSHNSISHCLGELVDRWVTGGGRGRCKRRRSVAPPGKGSICKARQRLGVEPLRRLFHRLAGPVAALGTPGAFVCGLRLMSVDGSTLRVADTPENLRAFGRSSGGRTASAFALMRFVCLLETGTHCVCDVQFGPFRRSEQAMTDQILRRGGLGPGMLLMWDRGLYSFDRVVSVLATGAQLLCRIKKNVRVELVEVLPDGSWLGLICRHATRRDERDAKSKSVCVRIVDYEVFSPKSKGPMRIRLLTTLCEHQLFPAALVAHLYHERWEYEGCLDEIKTHEMFANRPTHLRSQLPRTTVQELYGMLLAHLAIRTLMYEAASRENIDPDRLSFTDSLRVIRRHIVKASFKPTSPLLPLNNC
jgi:Insertion element 4 transposase N-terminal/Transposase DDE domain